MTCPPGTPPTYAPVAPPRSPNGATAAPCGHDAPPPSVDGPSQSTNTTTVAPRTRLGGPKKKRRTPTGTCGRPSSGPSPGSPAATPDVSHTEESNPTSNGSPPQQQPSTYNASSTSTHPHNHRLGTQPHLNHQTHRQPQKPGQLHPDNQHHHPPTAASHQPTPANSTSQGSSSTPSDGLLSTLLAGGQPAKCREATDQNQAFTPPTNNS